MTNYMGFVQLKGDDALTVHAQHPDPVPGTFTPRTFCGVPAQLWRGEALHSAPREPSCKICHVLVYRAGAPIAPPTGAAQPFLKWTGGKRSLLPQLERLLPDPDTLKQRVYYEPFLGGGAMFFHLRDRVRGAVLNDANADLINCYQQVRENVGEVESHLLLLAEMFNENDVETFYNVRESFNVDADCVGAARAAAFIFLNRTCFNGMYRVNKSGRFNVPMGRYKNPTIYDSAALRAASAAFDGGHVSLHSGRWQDAMPESNFERTFVYLDPPYDGTFTGYTAGGFGEADQGTLAQACRDLDIRGGLFMASNADTPLIRGLYARFKITPVNQKVSINSDPEGRGEIQDLVITNYGG